MRGTRAIATTDFCHPNESSKSRNPQNRRHIRHGLRWQSPRSKQVLGALQRLNHGNRKLPDSERFGTETERKSDEWHARYVELAELLEGWKEEEELSPDDYLYRVASTYSTLASPVPPGPARDNNLEAYLNFVEGRYAPKGNRNLWITQVAPLLREEQFLEHFARSRNPVMALYAKLHLELPRPRK